MVPLALNGMITDGGQGGGGPGHAARAERSGGPAGGPVAGRHSRPRRPAARLHRGQPAGGLGDDRRPGRWRGAASPCASSMRRAGGAAVRSLCRRAAAAAIELQHATPQLIERINTYFGHRAIRQLRLLQMPLPPPHRSPQPVRPMQPQDEAGACGRGHRHRRRRTAGSPARPRPCRSRSPVAGARALPRRHRPPIAAAARSRRSVDDACCCCGWLCSVCSAPSRSVSAQALACGSRRAGPGRCRRRRSPSSSIPR